MRILVIGLIALGAVAASLAQAQSQNSARPTIANEADYHRALKELSNWGRWGNDRGSTSRFAHAVEGGRFTDIRNYLE